MQRMKRHWKFFVPVAVLFSASICMKNAAMMYISVASGQFLVATAPLFVYVFSVLLGLEARGFVMLANVILMAGGASLSVSGTMWLSHYGVLLQLMGVVADSLRAVLLNLFLQKVDPGLSTFDAMQCITLPCCVMTALLCAFFEAPNLLLDLPTRTIHFWQALAAKVVLAVVLNLLQTFVLKRFHVLTLSIAGIAKDWTLILASSVVEGHSISTRFAIGGVVTFASSIWYVLHRLGQTLTNVAEKENKGASCIA